MNLRICAVTAVVGLVVASCATDGPIEIPPGTSAAIISAGAEAIVLRGGTLPPPSSNIAFVNSDTFDLALYSSLRSLSDVKVTFPVSSDRLPERLDLWTTSIGRSGAPVLACDTNRTAGLGDGLIGVIVTTVGSMVWDRVNEWALYRPSAGFAAIQEYDGRTGSFGAVRFIKANQVERVRATYKRCS